MSMYWHKIHDNTSSQKYRNKLEITSYMGMPEHIVPDRGTALTSKAFQKFYNKNNVKHILNAVRTPRANGLREHGNWIIPSMLLSSTDDKKRWDDKLRRIQWSINTMPNRITGCTPFQQLYKYTPRDILQNQLSRYKLTPLNEWTL